MLVQTLISPKWIVPVIPKGLVLTDHVVAVDHGEIVAIAPREQTSQFEAIETIELPDCVLLPGFVNCHSHAAMNLLRCAGADLSTLDWLNKVIWPAESKLMSPEFVHDGSLLGGAEMLSGGITTTCDMYFFPDAAIAGLRKAGMRVVQGALIIGFPSAEHSGEQACLEAARQLFERYKNDPLVTINIAPHAPYTVSAEGLKASFRLAQELDTTWQIHISESVAEVSDCLREHHARPVEYLSELGCLDKRTLAVHSVQLSEQEIELLGLARASTVHCPVSNMRLGCGVSPVAKLSTAGVNTALGTDGAASAAALNLLSEMRLAGMLAKGISQDPRLMPASDLLEMATIRGARALGLDHKIGSIEVGKRADLTAMSLNTIATMPVLDVITALIYTVERECVRKVWVDGLLVVDKPQGKTLLPNGVSLFSQSRLSTWQNRVCEILRGDSE